MANFALIKDSIVLSVIVIDNNIITDNGTEIEQLGIDFINSLNIKGVYDYDAIRQTSYNSNFRSKYAAIGDSWDETNNVFISPKPFASWTLNNNFKWQAPVSYPSSGSYMWNELELEWVAVTL
jgi:hypothetical protein